MIYYKSIMIFIRYYHRFFDAKGASPFHSPFYDHVMNVHCKVNICSEIKFIAAKMCISPIYIFLYVWGGLDGSTIGTR